ncbi:hypothetical protein DL765_003161 [Monosporascus sp. GIB2]|nr:hypothetical protein DL765_003161 [Monosporascus sp. GIB2]
MSDFDPTNGTPWTDTPGLYAALNIDGQTALDEDTNGRPQVIHGWEFGDSFDISNPNQLWQFAAIGDKKWLIINKKTGQYLAATGLFIANYIFPNWNTNSAIEDGGPVVPQTGNADKNTAHWRIVLAEAGDLYKVYVKFNGNCLTLQNGSSSNGTKIVCATQNKVKKGQVWCVKKQN